MRAAFYGQDSQWKKDIWARGQDIVEKALNGIGADWSFRPKSK